MIMIMMPFTTPSKSNLYDLNTLKANATKGACPTPDAEKIGVALLNAPHDHAESARPGGPANAKGLGHLGTWPCQFN